MVCFQHGYMAFRCDPLLLFLCCYFALRLVSNSEKPLFFIESFLTKLA